jgi:hypothetical protein
MPRSNKRRGNRNSTNDDNGDPHDDDSAAPAAAAARQLPEAVRNRQRAVAEREAARLARPERRVVSTLGHADRKKSAVTSTPFGVLAATSRTSSSPDDNAWCGPFSVARQMIAAREDAKRQREAEADAATAEKEETHPLDEAMELLEEETKRKAHPSLLWKSRFVTPETSPNTNTDTTDRRSKAAKRIKLPSNQETHKQKIPSLFHLCVQFVVANFEHVESLGPVGHDIRTKIAHALASKNQLNDLALMALTDDTMEALELIDCADISQQVLCETIQKTSLRYLQLDQAGRCFGKLTIDTLLQPNKKKKQQGAVPLFALNVGGAYLLRDEDASRLIAALAPTCQSLAFKACPLLAIKFCQSIPDNYSFNIGKQHLLVEFALEDLTLSRESWEALIIATGSSSKDQPQKESNNTSSSSSSSSSSSWSRNLKSLTLKRVTNLQDDLVIALLQGSPYLEHVDLSDNLELTDATLGALRPESCSLRSLHLANLKRLTNLGLETLFTPGLHAMGPPPQLKVLNLSHLDVDAVTDRVMELVLQNASRKPYSGADGSINSKTNMATLSSNANHGLSLLGGMVRLELQGAAITDGTLEQIAATSANTLEYLQVSFCPHMTDQGLGYLVDSVGTQLQEVQIWGCAQITERFWNGHARAVVVEGNKPSVEGHNIGTVPLQITGAWMKRSGIASIRT